jgi:hypothetical protein
MKRIISAIAAMLVLGNLLSAQEEALPYYFQLNSHFQAGVPLPPFSDRLSRTGIGGGGLLAFQLGQGRPLFAGVDVSYLRYDIERVNFQTIDNGVLTDFQLVTSNNILLTHGLLRFKPFTGFFIQPYFDGMLGMKWFYTRTRLLLVLEDEINEVVEANINQSDRAFSFGGAIGMQFRVSTAPDMLIDLRCAYLPGATARYMVRQRGSTGPFTEPIDAFGEAASPTIMLLPQLGITIQFSNRDYGGMEGM